MEPQSIALALALLVGLGVGALAAWLVKKSTHERALDAAVAKAQAEAAAEIAQLRERARSLEEGRRDDHAGATQLREQLDAARVDLDRARDEVARLTERAAQLSQMLSETRDALDAEKRQRAGAEADAARAATSLAETQVMLEGERKQAGEKLALLREAQETLSNQFKVLANQILDEKSQKFAEQNKTALGALLEPLRGQLAEFKGKVEEVYVQEGKDRIALAEQVRQLFSLNKTLSQDAQNLTDALKGNSQVQGAWGEWQMEQLFSSSGLVKDVHYVLQDSKVREDGSRARPDALINLPGGRQLVVDSKVSLVAYEQHVNAKSDDERALTLKGHLDSLRKHIGGLSDREYQKLYPTMDFVVLFVPIEPAFMLGVANDKDLIPQALERNVAVVSPSTLLFVLRTVAYLWRQEDQNRNAQLIADRGALLYDKFCGFLKDMESVEKALNAAQGAFSEASKKLQSGPGNLIAQAQKLTSLGVKGSKKIAPTFLQLADTDVDVAEDLAALAARNTPREADDDSAPGAEA